ncbi:biopolymer transporter ExbD [Azoarcus sp. DD4]|uniref:ExbD/TolR family protein n=1 Tax=Azoarcus sp. DD4 TaxID=2027405 RepID=UPI00112BE2B2|nr:biopolymer transporter ExbD [Azoarcus sp. DD4]QDF95313.1 biopolymer transporter ExbD [Azoarcus sp. DD4]
MAMNVGSADEDDAVMSAINTTPLVDVMLVLLIIFLLTIPVATVSVPVELPKESIEARETKPHNVILSVDKGGALFWHDQRVANADALVERLKKVSVQQPQPEVQIRGDLDAAYDGVGRILYACQRAGITKVAFITEPPARGG